MLRFVLRLLATTCLAFHVPFHVRRRRCGQSVAQMASGNVVTLAEWVGNKLETPSPELVQGITSKISYPYRFTASDASQVSGLTIEQCKTDLMLLSTITSGSIEVDKNGELIYSLPPNFYSQLTQKNFRAKLRVVRNKIGPPLFYVARVCFGVMLLTSITVIVGTFLVASSSSGSNNNSNKRSHDRDDDNRKGTSLPHSSHGSYGSRGGVSVQIGGPNLGNIFVNLFDIFTYRERYGYFYRQYDNHYQTKRTENGLSFIESFFSFIFGDGDPNVGFNDNRLAAVANVICEKDGVVVAEDLAPFLDVSNLPRQQEQDKVDESWVLPAVLHFGGSVEVTPSGNLFYVFPSLRKENSALLANERKQIQALLGGLKHLPEGSSEGQATVQTLDVFPSTGYMAEQPLAFSRAKPRQQTLAALLGAFNLGGVFWLRSFVQSLKLRGANAPLAMGLSRALPLLTAYALFYAIVPLIRKLKMEERNAEIQARSTTRRAWAKLLNEARRDMTSEYQIKVTDVEAYVSGALVKSEPNARAGSNVIYSSDDSEYTPRDTQ